MREKTVRFDYFRVRSKTLNEKQELSFPLYDIQEVLQKATDLTPTDRTYVYGEEEARLQKVVCHEKIFLNAKTPENPSGKCRIWELQFIRIRKDYLPGVANSAGDYDTLDLSDDEFIGEEVSVLYDPALAVMLIQRNRNSLSPSGIEGFLNEAIDNPKMILKPIHTPENMREMTSEKYYRSLSFALTDISHFPEDNDSSLGKIIKSIRKIDGMSVEIKVSLGSRAKKEDSLNFQELVNSIEELKGPGGAKKLELRVKNSIDAKVETYDLIDQRLMDGVSVRYSREEKIVHSRIIEHMLVLYDGKLKLLNEICR